MKQKMMMILKMKNKEYQMKNTNKNLLSISGVCLILLTVLLER